VSYFVWVNVVGFFGWCLFVVGHDCGHGSFSDSFIYNQFCGHVAHTVLLVPLNGWKISHRLHHTHHNHISKDHGWKPAVEDRIKELSPFGYALRHSVISMALYYWYLLCIPESPFLSGNHYNPFSRLFKISQRPEVFVSAICIFGWLAFVLKTFTLYSIFWYYSLPLVVFSIWLSVVTYLHHTHKDATIYADSTWSYFKGSLMTVDRSYGSIINHLHHNIETHVVHHIFFTSIPHYNLVEATKYAKPVLGSAYFFDDTPPPTALVRALKECSYIVEHEPDVYHFNGYDEKRMDRGRIPRPE